MSRWSAIVVVLLTTAMLILPAAALHIAHFSDFHFDPLFGKPRAVGRCNDRAANLTWKGLPGCDSSWEMVKRSLADAKAELHKRNNNNGGTGNSTTTSPMLMIYTGDWLRHGMAGFGPNATSIAVDIWTKISAELSADFGLGNHEQEEKKKKGTRWHRHHHLVAPVIPASTGNEDYIPDYHFNISNLGNNTLLNTMGDIMESHGLLDAAQAKTFKYCAYASAMVKSTKEENQVPLRAITLNTLVWSQFMFPQATKDDLDPCGQLAWLEQQLNATRSEGGKAYLISHIPPIPVFWFGRYYTQYKALLIKYNDVVAAQFYGHIHRFSFGAMTQEDSPSKRIAPIFIGGPITRVSGTIPDYAIMEVETTKTTSSITSAWEVKDLQQRYLSTTDSGATAGTSTDFINGQWMRQALNISTLSGANLWKVGKLMTNLSSVEGQNIFKQFYRMIIGGSEALADSKKCLFWEMEKSPCQLAVACSTIEFSGLEAIECLLTIFGADKKQELLRSLTL